MNSSKFETKIKKNVAVMVGIFLFILGGLALGFLTFSDMSQPEIAQAQTNERDKLNLRLQQIKSQINSYQQQINQTKGQAATLQNEISMYDNQIRSLELQIEANDTQTEDTKLQINELEIQIERREKEIADNREIMAKLIVELSKLDNNSFLQMSLGTDDFSSFLDQVQYVRGIQDQVYAMVTRIKDIKQKLELQQQDLEVQLTKLESLKEELAVTQGSLESQRKNKEQLLAQTKGVERNYQKLLTVSRDEQSKILEEINDLDGAARSKAGNKTISVSKGVFGWPMDGTLTQGYGNTGFTSLGYNFHNGLDIAAPAGTPIYAAADGTVAKCDTGEAAYGNWCTIKHNITAASGSRCVVSLYAHMRSIKVSSGQTVKRGDLVGYEGNTGNTTRLIYGPERGYHLHFSVFDCDGYTVTAGKYSSVYGDYSVPSGVTYNPMNFLSK